MNKIITIVGARPQFVKAAAVSREMANSNIHEILVHTGQHFDKNMSDVFFDEMQIPKPDFNLEINSLSHGAMTGRMMEQIEKLAIEIKPDGLMVYGDTNSTIAGALAAKKLHIPVIHVESGLRSFNMDMPEEVNRILTDRISDILFCPTESAVQNLKREGFDNYNCQIIQNGDVMYDAALFYSNLAEEKATVFNNSSIKPEEYILVTLHRQENTDEPNRLREIVSALNEIHKKYGVVIPLHPRTRKKLDQFNIELQAKTIDPVGYFDMIQLIKNSRFVMTDSGGLQKEAYFFKKACITMRDQTEWVELVNHGFNFLTGANRKKILETADEIENKNMHFELDLYGKGNASKKIVDILAKS